MRVSCPNCSTEYDVPDAALAGRSRKLRCELCGHKWLASGPAAGFVAAAPAWPVAPAPPPAPGYAPPAPAPAPAYASPPAAPAYAPPAPPAYAPPAAPAYASPAAAPAYTPPAPPAYAPPAAPVYAAPQAAPAYAAPAEPVYSPPPPPPPPPAYAPLPFPAGPPPAGGFPQPPVATVAPPPAPREEPAPAAYAPSAPVWAPLPEPPATFPPVEPRQFGRPADETALAEMQQAAAQEQKWQPLAPEPAPAMAPPLAQYDAPPSGAAPEEEGLPAFLTAAGADETLMLTAPYAASVSGDRFAELVYAARNKAIEVEPEPPPPPPVRTSNTPLFVFLVVTFLIACILVEHANIAHFIPATGPFFAALGLK